MEKYSYRNVYRNFIKVLSILSPSEKRALVREGMSEKSLKSEKKGMLHYSELIALCIASGYTPNEFFSEDIDLGKPRKKRQAVQIKRPLPFSDIAKNLMSFYELSGSEFSQMVETGAYSVNRWIKGETCPRLKNIDKIIRECEITPSQAMGFEGKIFDVPDKDEEFLKARDVDSFKKAEGRDTKEVHTDTDQAVLETLQKALGEDPPKAEKKPEVKKEPKERAPKSRAKKEVVREIGLDQSPLMIEAVHKLTAIPKDDIEAVLNAYNCALDVRSVFGI